MPDPVAVGAPEYLKRATIYLVVLLLFVLGSFQRSAAQQQTPPQKQPADTSGKKQSQNSQTKPLTAQEIFRRISPSVFVVEALDSAGATIALGSGVSADPLSDSASFDAFGAYDRIMGCPARSPGYSNQVITNKHVVKGSVAVRLRQAGKRWSAQIVYTDPDHDLCVLQVENLHAPSPKLRKSSELAIGERVYAIGAPNGFELSISDGLVSGLRDYQGSRVVQTTTAVSPGSSGGGLFDSRGRLIGITSFSAVAGQNLNFALPSELIESVCSSPAPTKPPSVENVRLADDEYRLGQSAMRRHLYEVAVRHLQEATRLQPTRADTWSTLGLVYRDLRRYGDAIAAHKEAIRLNARMLEDAKKDSPQSVDEALESLSLNWSCLGITYRAAERHQEATEALQEAAGLAPDDWTSWTDLAREYAMTGRCADAVRTLTEARRLHPELELRYIGWGTACYKEIGLPANAVPMFVNVVREGVRELLKDPRFVPFGERMLAQLASGLDAAGLGGKDQGTPEPSTSSLNRGDTRLTKKGVQRVSESIREGIQILSNNVFRDGFPVFASFGERMLAQLEGGANPALWFDWGIEAAESGRYEVAIIEFKKSLQYEPNFYLAASELIRIYEKLGRKQEADEVRKLSVP